MVERETRAAGAREEAGAAGAARRRRPGPPSASPSTASPPSARPSTAPSALPARPSAADRYGGDVLAVDPHRVGPNAIRPESVHVPVRRGLVVEDRQTGFVGAVVAAEKSGGRRIVVLEDRRGTRRGFPLGPGFWIDGRPVVLDPPRAAPGPGAGPINHGGRRVTASGSYAVEGEAAKVQLGYVQGVLGS